MFKALFLIVLVDSVIYFLNSKGNTLSYPDLGIVCVLIMLGWIVDEIQQCRRYLEYLASTLNANTQEEESNGSNR